MIKKQKMVYKVVMNGDGTYNMFLDDVPMSKNGELFIESLYEPNDYENSFNYREFLNNNSFNNIVEAMKIIPKKFSGEVIISKPNKCFIIRRNIHKGIRNFLQGSSSHILKTIFNLVRKNKKLKRLYFKLLNSIVILD